MNKKHFYLLIMLMISASFLGGAVSSIILSSQPVWALHGCKIPVMKKIRAESFQVVDKDGNIRAILGYVDKESQLIMYPGNQFPKRGICLITAPGGHSRLTLMEEDMIYRVWLGKDLDGRWGLDLLRKDGRILWSRRSRR